MRKGSFQDLIKMLKTQDMLRSNGYYPYGWWKKYLIWKHGDGEHGADEASVTRILPVNSTDPSKILIIDEINAIILS